MSYETVVGLQVTDDDTYTKYREAMRPILESFEGGFRYDFKVSETLKNEESKLINRVFVIYFGSKEKMERFFSDPEYLRIKKIYFAPSVSATTIISGYDR